jgi:Restriction endonuclease
MNRNDLLTQLAAAGIDVSKITDDVPDEVLAEMVRNHRAKAERPKILDDLEKWGLSQANFESWRQAFYPVILELFNELKGKAENGRLAGLTMLYCHVQLFGKWSLHNAPLSMLISAKRIAQENYDLAPIIALFFKPLQTEDAAWVDSMKLEIKEAFPDYLNMDPDRTRLNGIEIEVAEGKTTLTWANADLSLRQEWEQVLGDMNAMRGHDFENLIARLLESMGLEVQQTKLTGDGGVDILAHSKEPVTGGLFVVQCKRYEGSVGEPVIRDLYGVVNHYRASKGILITNARFTQQAQRFADGKPIELIDGKVLAGLFAKYKLVQEAPNANGINQTLGSAASDVALVSVK